MSITLSPDLLADGQLRLPAAAMLNTSLNSFTARPLRHRRTSTPYRLHPGHLKLRREGA